MSTLSATRQLVTEDCYKCGITFAMPTDFQRQRLNDRNPFYCPNGHGQSYLGKTDAQKLKEANRRLEQARTREQATRDQLDASERSRAAYKGVITRTKRRIANGVCPCCKRSFTDLADHMAGQHPGYADDGGES